MNRLQAVLLNLILILLISLSSIYSQIKLNPEGYFKTTGFRFLVYQNDYIGGRLGGLEMVLQGKRVLDAGNVVCITADGKRYGYYDDGDDKRGELTVDQNDGKVSYPVELLPLKLKYVMNVISDGESISIQIDLDQPIDWKKIKEFSFRIEIYPEEYEYKTFNGDGISDYFYEQHMGRRVLISKTKK